MAKDYYDYYDYLIDLENCKFAAEEMYNRGHRKLLKDSVVLSMEEYDNIKLQIQQAHNTGVRVGFYMTKFKEQSIKNKTSKETAEKFAKILNNKALDKTYINKDFNIHISDICKMIEETLRSIRND